MWLDYSKRVHTPPLLSRSMTVTVKRHLPTPGVRTDTDTQPEKGLPQRMEQREQPLQAGIEHKLKGGQNNKNRIFTSSMVNSLGSSELLLTWKPQVNGELHHCHLKGMTSKTIHDIPHDREFTRNPTHNPISRMGKLKNKSYCSPQLSFSLCQRSAPLPDSW